jgi:hypothetical protein
LVNSLVGVLTPKFSNKILKRYLSFGINVPWLLALLSVASGTVNLFNVAIDIIYKLRYSYLLF